MSEQPLYSPRVVRELLSLYNLMPTKSFGQNFLIDGNILKRIVEAAQIVPGDAVYEIGPGLGVLTQALAGTGAKVTSIEKDERLKPVLGQTLEGLGVHLHWGDCLEFPWDQVPEGSLLVANLPYYISTAILSQIFKSGRFRCAVVLVQKEVADRLVAQPGEPAYGFLSAIASLYGRAHIVRSIPKTAFFPVPEVTSALIRIDLGTDVPEPAWIHFLECCLAYRRKTLRNNLRAAGWDVSFLDDVLQSEGLPLEVRAEAIPLSSLNKIYCAMQSVTC